MTNRQHNHPDDDHNRLPIDPLRPDRRRCPCGATADRGGWCGKCAARAAWACRTAGRRRLDGDDRPVRTRVPRSRCTRAEALLSRRCFRPRPDEGIEL